MITKVTPADWEQYKQIRMQALYESPEAFAVTIEEAEARTDETWQELLQRPHVCTLMVLEDGVAVGMVRASWKPSNEKLRHIAEIGALYVAASQRGKGLGVRILSELEMVLRDQYQICKTKLYATEKNPAVGLYTKLGYRQVGLLEREICHEGTWYNEYLFEKWIH